MLETMLGISAGSILGVAGTLAAINVIIVEVLKNILPKKIPTKLVAMISAMIVVLGYIFIFGTITPQSIILGILGGFVVAFISMFGFDSLKDIFERFKIKEDSGGEKNE